MAVACVKHQKLRSESEDSSHLSPNLWHFVAFMDKKAHYSGQAIAY